MSSLVILLKWSQQKSVSVLLLVVLLATNQEILKGSIDPNDFYPVDETLPVEFHFHPLWPVVHHFL